MHLSILPEVFVSSYQCVYIGGVYKLRLTFPQEYPSKVGLNP